jgi:hypothetical protein
MRNKKAMTLPIRKPGSAATETHTNAIIVITKFKGGQGIAFLYLRQSNLKVSQVNRLRIIVCGLFHD